MLKCLLTMWLALAGLSSVYAESFSGRVVVVLDGDTVMVTRPGRRPVKVRLAGIDAPEKAQPFGVQSRQALVEAIFHRDVYVSVLATDKYGRLVAKLRLDNRDINQDQVKTGMAWAYAFFHHDRELADLQDEAQRARRGLWVQPNPQPPWVWRKLHMASNESVHQSKRPSDNDFSCGHKHRCAQMRSCDEAHYFLSHCGLKSLDKDHDGVPCPAICLPDDHRPR